MADEVLPDIYAIAVDENGVVNRSTHSNVLSEGFTEVTQEVYMQASATLGSVKYVDGELVDYTPPANPSMMPMLTRLQFISALAEENYNMIDWHEAEDWLAFRALPLSFERQLLSPRHRMYLLFAEPFARTHPAIEALREEIFNSEESVFNEFWLQAGKI